MGAYRGHSSGGRRVFLPGPLPTFGGLVTPRRAGFTYAASGVDRSDVSAALHELLRGTRYRPPIAHGRPLELPGHYAGLVRVGRETLAITTDTVGTKVVLAERVGRWEEVGEDLVGVNVNDLAAVGARPAALVDTILCDRPRPAVFRSLGIGLGRGLRRAKCALLGGETAVVPDLVRGIDLGGTALGFFPRRRAPVTGARIRPGDVLLGIPSRGLHANGFTLVRRLLDSSRVRLGSPRPGGRWPVGRELLVPTRIYSSAVDAVVDDPGIQGLAHISGGGVRNLPRLRPHVAFVLDRWPRVPGLFRWLQELGSISDEEMFQTFNMGIGFVLVVRAGRSAAVERGLARAGARDVVRIGRVERGRGVRLPAFGLDYETYS
ncbi:MAG: phosphoribosylformylglycinamidine cyclo-ligase [Thermoplasmata archaeon]|nr:phosphoribosylformylglycinamidine cyclo-ligase [Thermoplasmata archaeon]